jgi:hypothetical protein
MNEKAAKIHNKEAVIEYLEYVKDNVADVRNNMNVPSEIDSVVRKAVVEVIDDMVIRELRTAQPDNELDDVGNDMYN